MNVPASGTLYVNVHLEENITMKTEVANTYVWRPMKWKLYTFDRSDKIFRKPVDILKFWITYVLINELYCVEHIESN